MIIITITELVGIFIIVLALSFWILFLIISKVIDVFNKHNKGKK